MNMEVLRIHRDTNCEYRISNVVKLIDGHSCHDKKNSDLGREKMSLKKLFLARTIATQKLNEKAISIMNIIFYTSLHNIRLETELEGKLSALNLIIMKRYKMMEQLYNQRKSHFALICILFLLQITKNQVILRHKIRRIFHTEHLVGSMAAIEYKKIRLAALLRQRRCECFLVKNTVILRCCRVLFKRKFATYSGLKVRKYSEVKCILYRSSFQNSMPEKYYEDFMCLQHIISFLRQIFMADALEGESAVSYLFKTGVLYKSWGETGVYCAVRENYSHEGFKILKIVLVASIAQRFTKNIYERICKSNNVCFCSLKIQKLRICDSIYMRAKKLQYSIDYTKDRMILKELQDGSKHDYVLNNDYTMQIHQNKCDNKEIGIKGTRNIYHAIPKKNLLDCGCFKNTVDRFSSSYSVKCKNIRLKSLYVDTIIFLFFLIAYRSVKNKNTAQISCSTDFKMPILSIRKRFSSHHFSNAKYLRKCAQLRVKPLSARLHAYLDLFYLIKASALFYWNVHFAFLFINRFPRTLNDTKERCCNIDFLKTNMHYCSDSSSDFECKYPENNNENIRCTKTSAKRKSSDTNNLNNTHNIARRGYAVSQENPSLKPQKPIKANCKYFQFIKKQNSIDDTENVRTKKVIAKDMRFYNIFDSLSVDSSENIEFNDQTEDIIRDPRVNDMQNDDFYPIHADKGESSTTNVNIYAETITPNKSSLDSYTLENNGEECIIQNKNAVLSNQRENTVFGQADSYNKEAYYDSNSSTATNTRNNPGITPILEYGGVFFSFVNDLKNWEGTCFKLLSESPSTNVYLKDKSVDTSGIQSILKYTEKNVPYIKHKKKPLKASFEEKYEHFTQNHDFMPKCSIKISGTTTKYKFKCLGLANNEYRYLAASDDGAILQTTDYSKNPTIQSANKPYNHTSHQNNGTITTFAVPAFETKNENTRLAKSLGDLDSFNLAPNSISESILISENTCSLKNTVTTQIQSKAQKHKSGDFLITQEANEEEIITNVTHTYQNLQSIAESTVKPAQSVKVTENDCCGIFNDENEFHRSLDIQCRLNVQDDAFFTPTSNLINDCNIYDKKCYIQKDSSSDSPLIPLDTFFKDGNLFHTDTNKKTGLLSDSTILSTDLPFALDSYINVIKLEKRSYISSNMHKSSPQSCGSQIQNNLNVSSHSKDQDTLQVEKNLRSKSCAINGNYEIMDISFKQSTEKLYNANKTSEIKNISNSHIQDSSLSKNNVMINSKNIQRATVASDNLIRNAEYIDGWIKSCRNFHPRSSSVDLPPKRNDVNIIWRKIGSHEDKAALEYFNRYNMYTSCQKLAKIEITSSEDLNKLESLQIDPNKIKQNTQSHDVDSKNEFQKDSEVLSKKNVEHLSTHQSCEDTNSFYLNDIDFRKGKSVISCNKKHADDIIQVITEKYQPLFIEDSAPNASSCTSNEIIHDYETKLHSKSSHSSLYTDNTSVRSKDDSVARVCALFSNLSKKRQEQEKMIETFREESRKKQNLLYSDIAPIGYNLKRSFMGDNRTQKENQNPNSEKQQNTKKENSESPKRPTAINTNKIKYQGNFPKKLVKNLFKNLESVVISERIERNKDLLAEITAMHAKDARSLPETSSSSFKDISTSENSSVSSNSIKKGNLAGRKYVLVHKNGNHIEQTECVVSLEGEAANQYQMIPENANEQKEASMILQNNDSFDNNILVENLANKTVVKKNLPYESLINVTSQDSSSLAVGKNTETMLDSLLSNSKDKNTAKNLLDMPKKLISSFEKNLESCDYFQKSLSTNFCSLQDRTVKNSDSSGINAEESGKTRSSANHPRNAFQYKPQFKKRIINKNDPLKLSSNNSSRSSSVCSFSSQNSTDWEGKEINSLRSQLANLNWQIGLQKHTKISSNNKIDTSALLESEKRFAELNKRLEILETDFIEKFMKEYEKVENEADKRIANHINHNQYLSSHLYSTEETPEETKTVTNPPKCIPAKVFIEKIVPKLSPADVRLYVFNPKNNTYIKKITHTSFKIIPENVQKGSDTRTTCMIKNIPNKYTQAMLIDLLNEHHEHAYDFVFLRMDLKNKCNVGYAFINFTHHSSVLSFYRKIHGKMWKKFNSHKIAVLTYASIQGLPSLLARFKKSDPECESEKYRPLFKNHEKQK